MKLWLISQGVRKGYDTFDSAVVAAETEDEAKKIHPISEWGLKSDDWSHADVWAETPDQVHAELLGDAVAGTQAGVILASFNAG